MTESSARTILIQIASYRDTDLKATISDALAKASFPDRIHFAVVNQYCEDTKLGEEYQSGASVFSKIEVPWPFSEGVGWARDLTGCLYQEEDFFLQIDSHTRFDNGWDELLVRDWEDRNDSNVVLSTIPSTFREVDGGSIYIKRDPAMLFATGYDDDRMINTVSVLGTDPMKSRGLFPVGSFIFGPGKVLETCSYPMESLYFGESAVYGMSLFTHGYDLYQPKSVPIYHRFRALSDNVLKHSHDLIQYKKEQKLERLAKRESETIYETLFGLDENEYVGQKRSRSDFFNYLRNNLLAAPWPDEWPKRALAV